MKALRTLLLLALAVVLQLTLGVFLVGFLKPSTAKEEKPASHAATPVKLVQVRPTTPEKVQDKKIRDKKETTETPKQPSPPETPVEEQMKKPPKSETEQAKAIQETTRISMREEMRKRQQTLKAPKPTPEENPQTPPPEPTKIAVGTEAQDGPPIPNQRERRQPTSNQAQTTQTSTAGAPTEETSAPTNLAATDARNSEAQNSDKQATSRANDDAPRERSHEEVISERPARSKPPKATHDPTGKPARREPTIANVGERAPGKAVPSNGTMATPESLAIHDPHAHQSYRDGLMADGQKGLQSPEGVKAPSLKVDPRVNRDLLKQHGFRLVAYANGQDDLKLRFEIDPETGNLTELPGRPEMAYSTRGLGVAPEELPLLKRVASELAQRYQGVRPSEIAFLYLIPMDIDGYVYAKQMRMVRHAGFGHLDPRSLTTYGNFYEANGDLFFIVTAVENAEGERVRVEDEELRF